MGQDCNFSTHSNCTDKHEAVVLKACTKTYAIKEHLNNKLGRTLNSPTFQPSNFNLNFQPSNLQPALGLIIMSKYFTIDDK